MFSSKQGAWLHSSFPNMSWYVDRNVGIIDGNVSGLNLLTGLWYSGVAEEPLLSNSRGEVTKTSRRWSRGRESFTQLPVGVSAAGAQWSCRKEQCQWKQWDYEWNCNLCDTRGTGWTHPGASDSSSERSETWVLLCLS